LDSKKIPALNINFKVYDSESNELYGVAEATLPDFEAMSESISGAGLSGEIEMVVLGHFGSMTTELSWRAITDSATKLLAQKAHHLDLRGSVESYDTGSEIIGSYPVKASIIGIPKNLSLGNLNVGAQGDSSSEFELLYIKLLINNEEVVELDKINYIFRVHGVDYLESVRRDLGMSS
jgi:P2 family phage contractile tail tube protein